MASPYPSGPLPFIMSDEDFKFHVNKETAQVLTRIEKPMVVVAIVGKYRTGKSFLMNRLARTTTGAGKPKEDKKPNYVTKRDPGPPKADKDEDAYTPKDKFKFWKTKEKEHSPSEKPTKSQPRCEGPLESHPKQHDRSTSDKAHRSDLQGPTSKGFTVGHTMQSQTKGIWAWPVPHPVDKEICLLLLDMEGLGDSEKANEEHDIWLFIMAVLLSNVLVYNTEKTLDNKSLEQLRYVKNMSEHVRSQIFSRGDKPSILENHLPSLVVCVRDCALKLVWDEKLCTPDEYMEKCFQIRRSNSLKDEEFNRERDLMCAYFKKRKCFMFPMPADPEDMDELENKLSKKFLKVTEEFTSHIYQIIKYKNIDGVILTGQLFLQVAELYVQAQRSGDMACIEGARKQVVLLANMQAMEDAKRVYQREMETLLSKLPVDYKQLQRHQEECSKKAMALFYRRSVLDRNHEHEKELLDFTMKEFERMKETNTVRSYSVSKERLEVLYQLLKEMNADFMQPGGYQKYEAAMQELDEEYRATEGLGDEKDKAYKDFMEKYKDRAKQIRIVDKALTQAQQEEIKRRTLERINEQQMEALKMENKAKEADIALLNSQQQIIMRMFNDKLNDIQKHTDENIREIQKTHQKEMDSVKNKSKCVIC
ncbi:unnamed protein product [Lampetra planeri]